MEPGEPSSEPLKAHCSLRDSFIFNSLVLNLHSSASLTIRGRPLLFVSASFPGLKLMRLLYYCRNISYGSFKG